MSPWEFARVARQTVTFASQNLSLRFARRWCSWLLVPTQLMASEAVDHGFDRTHIHIVNYGVDIAEAQLAVAYTRTLGGATYDAIFVGRFHVQKGLDDLLAVWRQVQAALPSARLGVVGDGTGWNAVRFKRQIDDFENRTASHLGVLTGSDKFAAMSSSTVFLFPSHHESWGHVVLEAMALGLPVVGYDLPSSREAFGDAMFYVPAFDVTAFADAVVRCLTDEDTRETFRTRGLETAKRYDWNVIAQHFASCVLE
jgi:glycosyltransferase involved in cell wall biosynthesis